jgi:hypothetical protein
VHWLMQLAASQASWQQKLVLLLLMLHLLMPHQLALLYCVERTHKTILLQTKSSFIWILFVSSTLSSWRVNSIQRSTSVPCDARLSRWDSPSPSSDFSRGRSRRRFGSDSGPGSGSGSAAATGLLRGPGGAAALLAGAQLRTARGDFPVGNDGARGACGSRSNAGNRGSFDQHPTVIAVRHLLLSAPPPQEGRLEGEDKEVASALAKGRKQDQQGKQTQTQGATGPKQTKRGSSGGGGGFAGGSGNFGGKKCHNCGGLSHLQKDCPKPKAVPSK